MLININKSQVPRASTKYYNKMILCKDLLYLNSGLPFPKFLYVTLVSPNERGKRSGNEDVKMIIELYRDGLQIPPLTKNFS